MIDNHLILGVIPARGGSQGVPGKNIKPLAGRPLIAYAMESAQKCQELDCLVVSTDDPEIKSVALDHGCRVIDRPDQLAGPEAPTEVALLHALDVLEQDDGKRFDYVVVLEPTSPFRSATTIRGACRKIIENDGQSLLAVRESREVTGELTDDLFRPHKPGQARRRQDRQPFYVEASTIYVASTAFLRQTGSLVAEDWLGFVVPPEEAVDINTLEDFSMAESLMKAREKYHD